LWLLLLVSAAASAQQVEWLRKFGVAGSAVGAVADSTGMYVTGSTRAPLPGSTGTDLDVYVRKYSLEGDVLWSRQFKIGSDDQAAGMAVDERGIFIAGLTQTAVGAPFVTRLDLGGHVVWSRVLDHRKVHWLQSIATHVTGIYVVGQVTGPEPGAVIAKLDFQGNELWTTLIRGTGDDMFTGVAVDDTGVYCVGTAGDADILKLDFNGQVVARLGDGALQGNAIAQDSSGIYAVGQSRDDYLDYRVWKYERSGQLLWQRALEAPADIALEASGLYLVIANAYAEKPQLARYTLNGDFVWQGDLGQSLGVNDVAVHDGTVYPVGVAYGANLAQDENDTKSFVARYSATRPPELVSLGLIDKSSSIATVVHEPGVPSVVVKVQNATNGAVIARVNFSAQYHPGDIAVVPDRNGNGAPELVMLGIHETAGNIQAEIRDSRSGSRLNAVQFPKNFMPRRLAVVPGVAANRQPGLAVLGASNVDRVLRVQIKDSVTGEAIRSIDFSRYYLNEPLAELMVVPDINGNGSPELSVLLIGILTHGSRLMVKDALTGETINDGIYFSRNFCPRDLAVIRDLDGNGDDEIATLLQGCWNGERRVWVDIRDPATGQLTAPLGNSRLARPVALVPLPDFDRNGIPELGLLALGVGTDKDVLSVRDPLTNAWMHNVTFVHDGYRHRGVVRLPDMNGNGHPEVAQLQDRRSDGARRIVVKDSATGGFIGLLR
jgi:hypothetical protein